MSKNVEVVHKSNHITLLVSISTFETVAEAKEYCARILKDHPSARMLIRKNLFDVYANNVCFDKID